MERRTSSVCPREERSRSKRRARLPILRLALYEVPYDVDGETAERQREYVAALARALENGQRSEALRLFMRVAGSSASEVAAAECSEVWPELQAIAHTLAYDAACLGSRAVRVDELAQVQQTTLVITGGSAPPFEAAADVMAAALPRARRLVLPGQSHAVDARVLAPALAQFFSART